MNAVRIIALILFFSCDIVIDFLIYNIIGKRISTSNYIALGVLLFKAWCSCFLIVESKFVRKLGVAWYHRPFAPLVIYSRLSSRVKTIIGLVVGVMILFQLAFIFTENPSLFRLIMSLASVFTVCLVTSLVTMFESSVKFEEELENSPLTHPIAFAIAPLMGLINPLLGFRERVHQRECKRLIRFAVNEDDEKIAAPGRPAVFF